MPIDGDCGHASLRLVCQHLGDPGMSLLQVAAIPGAGPTTTGADRSNDQGCR
jgi:hypothetical protein